MSKDLPYDLNSVQATNVMPLWGRATYSAKYPDLLTDPLATEIMEKMLADVDLDVSLIEKMHGKRTEYFGLIFCVRGRNLDDGLQSYLTLHPNATVVNLGVGLETNFARNDNGLIEWYDLDFPNVIEFRKRYLPEKDRYHYITKSVLDFTWIDEIEYTPEKGIFIIASGLLMYLSEKDVKRLLTLFCEHFSRGEFIFDSTSKLGIKIGNKRTLKAGKTDMLWKFYTDKPLKQYPNYHPNITVVNAYKYWDRTEIDPTWTKTTKRYIKFNRLLKLAYFIHLKF